MNKIILLLIFLSLNIYAKSDFVPDKMFTHKNIFENTFRPLRKYILSLKQIYPYTQTSDQLVFYTENTEYSHFNIQLFRNNGNFMLRFMSENSLPTEFIFKFSDKQQLSIDDFIEFKFSENLDAVDYTVEVYPMGFVMESKLSNSRDMSARATVYTLGEDATQIYLDEQSSEKKFESAIWYKCSGCNGDPIKAVFTPQEERYFLSWNFEPVDDIEFYTLGNRSYVSGVITKVDTIINQQLSSGAWPAISN